MIRVEISRERWGRGRTGGYLRREPWDSSPGLQCCLGFICEMAGLGDYIGKSADNTFPHSPLRAYLRDQGIRNPTEEDIPKVLRPLVWVWVSKGLGGVDYGDVDYKTACGTLAAFNDDLNISDTEREEKLTSEAAKIGYEFVFVD